MRVLRDARNCETRASFLGWLAGWLSWSLVSAEKRGRTGDTTCARIAVDPHTRRSLLFSLSRLSRRERCEGVAPKSPGGTYTHTYSRTPLRSSHTRAPTATRPFRRRARLNLRFFGPKIVQGINQSSVSTMVAVHSREPEPYVGLTSRGGGATHVSVFATAKMREKEGEGKREREEGRKMHAHGKTVSIGFRRRCSAKRIRQSPLETVKQNARNQGRE